MPSPFKNPDLMVIGDSPPQGCHSLSVTAEFCARSYAAQAAGVLSWNFAVPTFPHPVIFDLEEIVRDYLTTFPISLAPLLEHLENNLNFWRNYFQSPPVNSPDYFDNLAVTAATLEDTELLRYSYAEATMAANKDFSFLDLSKINVSDLSNLVMAINSGFVLNPSGKKDYADYNMFKWVEVRKPQRLLVHMGHNDGLYAIGGDAQPGQELLQLTAQNYIAVVDQIEQITDGSQQLIFVLLPKISSVANLDVSGRGPNKDGYWTKYEPVFSFSRQTFDAVTMAEQDKAVLNANQLIQDRLDSLRTRRNVSVISAYDLFDRLDYKNSRKRAAQVVIDGRVIDNRYIEEIGPILVQGGMQGIDGMHPTTIGYCELAIELIRLYNPDFRPKQLLKRALHHESLITKPPIGLGLLVALIRLARHIPRDSAGRPIYAEQRNVIMELATLIELLSGIMKRRR